MVRPVRVYLDQKDYGRIADAVCRGNLNSPDYLAYEKLLELVSENKVRVYFSYVHVVEALRFGNVRSPLVAAYCDAIDDLTGGHCIRFLSHLQRAELALALSREFGVESEYSSESYPYGMFADSVTTEGLELDLDAASISSDGILSEIEKCREEFLSALPGGCAPRDLISHANPSALAEVDAWLPAGMGARKCLEILLVGSTCDRAELASVLARDRNFLGRMLTHLSDEALNDLNEKFPASDFQWTRDLCTTALVGTLEEKSKVWDHFFRGAMTFKQLVRHYSLTQPIVSGLGRVLDGWTSNLVQQLRAVQEFEPVRRAFAGTEASWDHEIANSIADKFTESKREDVVSFALRYGFPAQEAERKVRANVLRTLPYAKAVTIWVQSYLARHKGTKYARKPEENDFRDLLHCVNAAYVDFLVTDRFSAEIARPIGEEFQTRIVRSLAELTGEIDKL